MPEGRNSVRMVMDNHDIKFNEKVRERYPDLYHEVLEHDRDSFSSWYSLSDIAYQQWLVYMNDTEIGYVTN